MTNKEAIKELEFMRKFNYTLAPVEVFDLAIKALEDRPMGNWIDYQNEGFVECPFCGSTTNCEDNKDELHYCFSCVAQMSERGSDK